MSGPGEESMLDLAAAYALGALSPDEVQRFEAFLATSPDARREVAELREVATLLALDGSEIAPAADLRDRVLARIGRERGAPLEPERRVSRGRRAPPLYWGALAASVLIAAGLGWSLRASKADVAALRDRVSTAEATLDQILEPGVKLYQLTSSGDPEPGLQLFWDQRRHTAIINGYRLRPLPSGREYQLWFIKDGQPVPSVTFRPRSDGRATLANIVVPRGGTLSAAAITVEPAGGSAAPTTTPVLSGALQQPS